ncbi:TPA: cob(I)yrinic acid a,c-diamide adenosyltransferase [Candidatus Beckwithbacteria bacterium]|nr:MAG: cob(I)yrinic acid a,c-diamide adenosyltransferase CobO [Candidatus Beckwithbacteria bacterium GW2011_GWC1_49_16]OGD48513.1 MAG: hypothetical protein A2877_02070 [Candidatus Beckwithbacteria bacterium RIFCSPHIGHO2_01_FULL_49_39]OGD50618.1 MAG: hypothetical protein A3D86_00735 [Candidatus Beckwithbacteria bacterium RIFCSPHIGHO2_02_FULL_49_13]OGD51434.1 MAG: hypothetical protein A3K56_04315 [Candidatus Beckwithbacteria bacterium RIFCSPHIGHO2_12_FULL_49_13]OGD58528.1 MAG: hypothetical prote
MSKGLVYVFTGDGKGKTSAAFWTGVRLAARGKKVAAVQFYKEARWPTAEQDISKKFKNFKVYLSGKGFYKLPTDHAKPAEHKQAAEAGLKKAAELIGKVDLLILDEINNAVKDKLIDLTALIDLISKRGQTHLILTGRGATRRVLEGADLVTEMKKVKHPFDQGKKAVKGLDY